MKYTKTIAFILFSLFWIGCVNLEKKKKDVSGTESTDQTGILTKVFTYEGDTTLQGYLASPADTTKKYPGIIVVHEWWGHNDYARKRADMLAELGYVAMALDMYGAGKVASHPQDAMTFAGSVMQNIEVGRQRFDAAIRELKKQPMVDVDKIGAIGYCFGGSVVLSMANAGYDLDAVAAFHSGVQLPIMPGDNPINASILVCNGADDPFITAEQVGAFTSALDKVGADYNYIAYEGATHSFTSPDADSLGKQFELPLAYNAEADQLSWQEMQDLFKRSFSR